MGRGSVVLGGMGWLSRGRIRLGWLLGVTGRIWLWLAQGHCITLSWFGPYSGILPFALGSFVETLALALH